MCAYNSMTPQPYQPRECAHIERHNCPYARPCRHPSSRSGARVVSVVHSTRCPDSDDALWADGRCRFMRLRIVSVCQRRPKCHKEQARSLSGGVEYGVNVTRERARVMCQLGYSHSKKRKLTINVTPSNNSLQVPNWSDVLHVTEVVLAGIEEHFG